MLLLTACQTYRFDTTWPSELPPKEIFVAGFLEKRQIKKVRDVRINSHLEWIKKFYLGTLLHPNGWLNASDRFLDTVDSLTQRRLLRGRLYDLGISISNEWAQNNNVRLINSANMIIWGSAMQTAAEQNKHEEFLSDVENDVIDLISGKLKANEIRYERYFHDELFDDF